MYTWPDLTPERTLGRTPQMQQRYNEFRQKHPDIVAYLSGVLEPYWATRSFVITLNGYPYDLPQDIVHCVVWLNPRVDKDIAAAKAKKYIAERFTKYVLHENAPHNRSVHGITHLQFFVDAAELSRYSVPMIN